MRQARENFIDGLRRRAWEFQLKIEGLKAQIELMECLDEADIYTLANISVLPNRATADVLVETKRRLRIAIENLHAVERAISALEAEA